MALLLVAVVVVTVILCCGKKEPPTTKYGWGDSVGGRPSYTMADGAQEGAVLNSLSDGPQGDEKGFVKVAKVAAEGEDPVWQGGEISVEDGQVYMTRVYVGNNGKEDSTNTRVAINIPNESAKEVLLSGMIFSDNATPNSCWSSVLLTSKKAFHLDYFYGASTLSNETLGEVPIGDGVVTKAASENGVAIGYSALDGVLPGGGSGFVTIRFRVVVDELHRPEKMDFTTEAKVRLLNEQDWSKSITTQTGDYVQVQLRYQNTDKIDHYQVTAKVNLPAGTELVPGTTVLYNVSYEHGETLDADTIASEGIPIGTYTPGSNAYVRCTVKINSDDVEEITAGFVVSETSKQNSCKLN